MYLHLGQSTVITHDEIIGIFDLDNTTVSKKTRDYLSKAEKEGRVNELARIMGGNLTDALKKSAEELLELSK